MVYFTSLGFSVPENCLIRPLPNWISGYLVVTGLLSDLGFGEFLFINKLSLNSSYKTILINDMEQNLSQSFLYFCIVTKQPVFLTCSQTFYFTKLCSLGYIWHILILPLTVFAITGSETCRNEAFCFVLNWQQPRLYNTFREFFLRLYSRGLLLRSLLLSHFSRVQLCVIP